MSIDGLGWNVRWDALFVEHRSQGCEPGRISGQDRERYDVIAAGGESAAEVSGRFRHEARGPSDFPAIGDWVALRPRGHDGPRTIVAVLPRATAFVRKQADEPTEAQVVAANVDAVFVVAGLDGDLNVRRIERYLATAWDGGATPVVVLNKADLADDLEGRIAEVEAVAPGVSVVAVSATEARGLEALGPWLAAGRTIALLGSSGVGKSTLVNVLLGEARQQTTPVREWDSRGRHTTTRRELVALAGGAWLIDTPGIRQLQLWADEASLDRSFPEIAELAARCRFRDCRHATEPGCAVREAERDGTLPAERVASWRKLQRELVWLAAKQDQRLRAEQHARWRAIHLAQREHAKRNPKR
jgi:ribosome biogenesis GTPase / thiamine phosphate phosphatase